jgi:hypothetical protein
VSCLAKLVGHKSAASVKKVGGVYAMFYLYISLAIWAVVGSIGFWFGARSNWIMELNDRGDKALVIVSGPLIWIVILIGWFGDKLKKAKIFIKNQLKRWFFEKV